MTQTRAKLFAHGGSQAVRLPKAFRFKGDEVAIRKEGDRVILEPVRKDFSTLWAEIDRLQKEAGELFPERPPQGEFPPPVDFDK